MTRPAPTPDDSARDSLYWRTVYLESRIEDLGRELVSATLQRASDAHRELHEALSELRAAKHELERSVEK